MQSFSKVAGRSAVLLSASVLAVTPAFASVGTQRNQAALAYAGRGQAAAATCVAPVGTPLAVRNQCAMGDEANNLRGRGGSLVVAVGATVAIGLGIAAALSNNDDDPSGTAPPAPPVSAA